MKWMGGREKTEDFFRMFLIPGVHLKGQPPTVLSAQRLANGAPERALPIYPYPVVARYSGRGDLKQPSSFLPFDPAKK